MRIQESRASLGEIWKSRASLWGNTGGQLWDLGRFRCGSHLAREAGRNATLSSRSAAVCQKQPAPDDQAISMANSLNSTAARPKLGMLCPVAMSPGRPCVAQLSKTCSSQSPCQALSLLANTRPNAERGQGEGLLRPDSSVTALEADVSPFGPNICGPCIRRI